MRIGTLALAAVFATLLAPPLYADSDTRKPSHPKVGDVAPAFKAKDQDGKTITLSEYKGKQNVVLYFYPADETGGCTMEACSFRDDMHKYASAKTVVLGVSTQDAKSHKHFAVKDSLNFSLLDDASGVIGAEYGVLGPAGDAKYASRETFLIDKQGIIRKHYDDFTRETLLAQSADLLKTIAELK